MISVKTLNIFKERSLIKKWTKLGLWTLVTPSNLNLCVNLYTNVSLRVSQHFLFLIEEGMLFSQVPIQVQEWGVQEEDSNKILGQIKGGCIRRFCHVTFWLDGYWPKETHQPNQHHIYFYYKRILRIWYTPLRVCENAP